MNQALTAVITYEATINEPTIENMLWIIRDSGHLLSDGLRIVASDAQTLIKQHASNLLSTDAMFSTVVDLGAYGVWHRLINRSGDNDRPLYDVTVYLSLRDVFLPTA